ncbi:MAG: hypothetical protein JNL75_01790 [Chitinophagales bacterium]|nr:hypothetical protein [Chitinophagales bacterium]
MKKLVLLFILAFAFNQNEIQAQSIVNPVEDGFPAFDFNATDIILENKSTREVLVFSTTAELYASWSRLSSGRYQVEYTLHNERNKINLTIRNNQ